MPDYNCKVCYPATCVAGFFSATSTSREKAKNSNAQMSQRQNETGQIHWTQPLRDSVIGRKACAVSSSSEIRE